MTQPLRVDFVSDIVCPWCIIGLRSLQQALAAAREAGLDPERARQILESGEYTDEVRALEAFWQSRGIHAVPSIIFNQHWMLQGAQPPEQFERAIRAIITGAAEPAPAP